MIPRTGTPRIRLPCLRGSSSTKQTGTSPLPGLVSICRARAAPVSPAPTRTTRRPDWPSSTRRREKSRDWNRTAPISRVARAAAAMTVRGPNWRWRTSTATHRTAIDTVPASISRLAS